MLTALIISQVISWLLIVGLSVAVLALARQVGVLHVRVAPAGALTTAGGPAVGDKSPHIDAIALDGRSLTIGGKLSTGGMRLLMFVSAQCPLCKGLIPVAKSFAKDERVDLVFVGDDTVGAQHALIERFGLDAYPFVNGPETGTKFGVEKLPYAVLLDDQGRILSKGLVNSREHLESLVIAHELGVQSVQDYISGVKSSVAA